MKIFNILNIEPIKADVEKSSKISSNSCNLVLMTNLLFQVDDIKGVLKEAKRILKPRGRILVVDWLDSSSLGPEKKVSEKDVKKMAENLGFNIKKEFKAGIYHWALILTKPR